MTDFVRDHPGRLFLLATLLPLAAAAGLFAVAVIRGMWGRASRIPDSGAWVVLLAMATSAGLSLMGLSQFLNENPTNPNRWRESIDWLRLGAERTGKPITLGYHIDILSALMITMVTIIGTLIVLFSTGYLKDERDATVEDHLLHHSRRGRFGRFFAYLGLFCFSMLNLLIADNLLQVFMSWELVGVCSFLLIGFYTERPTATTAANKAFIVNRIGDAGFLTALFILYAETGGFAIGNVKWTGESGLVFGICLFIGCMGKSAQVPLQTWLPDAMEGPTPVSALIHAATMVAAGVYLVGRCLGMMDGAFILIIIVGSLTAFLSATIAVVQNDIKRILAFSTCSQLGLMMLALGIGAWPAALLHLLTHAFFKALLFLGAGSVIHACHHEQDIRNMGGLRREMPITATTMLIGVLAISGIPFLSGWASKDLIVSNLVAIFQNGYASVLIIVPFALAMMTVVLTAYYMMRLWLMTFAGTPRDSHREGHVHESPAVMTIPLVILSLFSVGVAFGWPIWDPESGYVYKLLAENGRRSDLESAAHKAHTIAGIIALSLAILGITTAFWRHRSGAFLRESNATGLRYMLDQRWFFDTCYQELFVRPAIWLGRLFATADKSTQDVGSPGVGYDLRSLDGTLAAPATFLRSLGGGLREASSGRIRGYVLAMALTLVAAWGILSRFAK
jgi:NADH-quinone oxidoreductase subunit L